MGRFIALLGLISLLLVALGGIGYKYNWWDLGTAFTFFRNGPYVAMGSVVVIAFYWWFKKPSTGFKVTASISIIAALVAIYFPMSMKQTAQSLPFIHDITTDTQTPPKFVSLVALREADPKTGNPTAYQGEEVAEQQRQGYPDLTTQVFTLDTDLESSDIFEAALVSAKKMGWEIVDTNEQDGRIEAIATTLWFGFKDDVVIRLTELDGNAFLDIRSKSRVGKSDVGANAKRIVKWQKLVTEALKK